MNANKAYEKHAKQIAYWAELLPSYTAAKPRIGVLKEIRRETEKAIRALKEQEAAEQWPVSTALGQRILKGLEATQ